MSEKVDFKTTLIKRDRDAYSSNETSTKRKF